MNVASKLPIASNNSRHATSWQFYFHCGIWETGRPRIICTVGHQGLRHPSVHGTTSMGKLLLATAHIAMLNQFTESEDSELTTSTVVQIALAIQQREGSQWITIESVQRKFVFNIQHNPYWLKWQAKRLKLTAKDFETFEFYQHTGSYYLMLWFFSAFSPCNAISNPELWLSYKALRSDLVLLVAITLSNIGRREYSLNVH